MSKKLIVIAGPDEGREFDLPQSGTVKIGRGTDTLTQLKDVTVSRNHCQIEVTDQGVVLTNVSVSGTQVKDKPIIDAYELQKDDVIHLGDTKLRYDVVGVHEDKTVRGDIKHLLNQALNGLAGTTLAHFQVGKLIAEGIAGPVFRARDSRHNRDVALKVFLPNTAPKGPFPKLLQPALDLQHPNLVALLEAGKTEAHTWVATEYVEGESLEKQLERAGLAGMLDWQHVLRYGIHLASALDVLHQRQVVHRSVTPRSILIARSDKQAKLGALWQARAARDCQAESDLQDVLRNVGYMPPERLAGGQAALIQSDIYGLGAVLYTLLAGRPPFEGETQKDIIAKVVQTEPVAPKEFQLSLPDAFQHAVLRMLAKRPADRYQNAGELLTELQHLAERQTSGTPPPAGRSPAAQAPPPRSPISQAPLGARSPIAPAPAAVQAPVAPAPPAVRAPDDGKLVVTCTCGQELQARKRFAGTQVRCPCCGTFILLPGRPAFGHTGEQPHAGPGPLHDPQRNLGPAAIAAPQKPSGFLGNELVRYGIMVVLLILTLLVTLAGFFLDGSPRQQPTNKATPEPVPTQPAPKQGTSPQK